MDELAILFVDDEQIILSTLEQVFRANGYKPYCSLNGSGALELLQAHRFRVIFTDLRMPEMDGMELCRCIKEHDPDASVFALSAYVGAFTEEQFAEAGFDGQFHKPFNIAALLKATQNGFKKIASKDLGEKIASDPRRSQHRIVLEEKVIASILKCAKDPSLVGKTLDCTDCTLSMDGLQVVVNGLVEQGVDLQLHLGISGNPGTYVMDGVVRWANDISKKYGDPPLTRAGIEFLPTSRDIERWQEFLSHPALRKYIVNT